MLEVQTLSNPNSEGGTQAEAVADNFWLKCKLMTLNVTVVTRRCIYQSADYCLMNLITHQPFPCPTQKIILKNTFRWSATVCFAGIALTNNLIVGEWLAERMNAIEPDDPFERLLDELLTAQNWLSAAVGDKRHSFSVKQQIRSYQST